jgi:hypothetical protein
MNMGKIRLTRHFLFLAVSRQNPCSALTPGSCHAAYRRSLLTGGAMVGWRFVRGAQASHASPPWAGTVIAWVPCRGASSCASSPLPSACW